MNWHVFRGDATPHDGIQDLPPPPPWRTFDGEVDDDAAPGATVRAVHQRRGAVYRSESREEIDAVNAALALRRPLLLTGSPGAGKSSLAYAVAYELQLGPVLHWPIISRSTVTDGLYQYDALSRVQDATLAVGGDIGAYMRLGPLGTALLPRRRPRVLLIDEIDKSDIDLPNDLLTIFEDGEYTIPELARLAERQPEVEVASADADDRVVIRRGHVRCREFPFVVLTSNGEREFPPAFLRRCIRLRLPPPSAQQLARIVEAHLGDDAVAASGPIIERFLAVRGFGDVATDQLLNAIYLTGRHADGDDRGRERVLDLLLQALDPA
ncbi:AAA family ATPase [Dactylosporangium aurantiacum]|uniref:AAA family ATPase n=1 Tax=Dactylosporangium aurantiacum TaxID=35754 RepID=A0A9Q9ISH0_9ACTN|nr:MoxR family ATPase [Dactylosporangium aurantiacum]MDG6108258.1 MoxR family ATPase [Dactylosporangium aurantiacum]UWZ58549.1 AAA family ATPase [Dactylosporangium aurantiacum]